MKLLRRLDDGKGTALLLALLFMSSFAFLFIEAEKRNLVKVSFEPRYLSLNSLEDIVPLGDSVVEPIIYSNAIGFKELTTKEKKEKFIATMLPAILIVKRNWDTDRQRVLELINRHESGDVWTGQDSIFVGGLLEKYKTDDAVDLSIRLKTHPASIVLAQAAVESGWGTSRFFSEANNVFGVWSFNKNEPRIRAAGKRGDKPVYLKKYDYLEASIDDYFTILARAHAYNRFREVREHSDNPFELIWYLRNYSELRDRYVVMLGKTITSNDLAKYDAYKLKPKYPMP